MTEPPLPLISEPDGAAAATEVSREAKRRSTQEIVHKREQTVPIARRCAKDFEGLVAKCFNSRHGHRDKEPAGMAVSVEIKTGKRRMIEYFLSPLLQHGSESLRER